MKRLTILFAAFIILVIILADAGKLGLLGFVYNIPLGDKLAHFTLYGMLALLINLTLFRSLPPQRRRWVAIISGLVLAFLIGLEELSQQVFANRDSSLFDLTASYLGVLFFSWLAVVAKKE